MCQNCSNPNHTPLVDIEAEMDLHQRRMEDLNELDSLLNEMTPRDREFASDLCQSYVTRGGLTAKQWEWVTKLSDRVRKAEPIYGDFKAIHVMFQLAGETIKAPKVRLLSDEGTFVQLNFKADSKDIDVYRDGWQGHGYRKFVGWIRDNQLIPYRTDRLTDDVKMVIQELALDPLGTAKAMAGKLGACMYCGRRLSDPISKKVGYGETCAHNYGLPWK